MRNFYERTKAERGTIRNFYEFEASILATDPTDTHYMECISEPNPYYVTIMQWDDGKEVIEALNFAIEMAYNKKV